ncbi:MAG: hypothetical protein RI885_1664 [Actinomycetota bacterium]
MTVFWERGYEATTIDQLVVSTGLGRSSLYSTFGDKESLFLRCLARYEETVAARLLEALQRHPSDALLAVGGMFDAILTRLRTTTSPSGCLITLTAAERSTLTPAVQARIDDLLSAQVRAVRAVLTASRQRGRAPHAGDADSLAEYLVGTAQSLALLHRAGVPVAKLRGVAATALHVLKPLEVLRLS